MNKILYFFVAIAMVISLTACNEGGNSSANEAQVVEQQQDQYQIGQPVPTFDWSLERHLLSELYKLRNKKVTTHAVWRSDYGMIEGDCPSMGYGLPYDTSLTNPLVSVDRAGNKTANDRVDYSLTSVEQPEPNGIFASKNTSATWVICMGETGGLEPVYVESKVTIYPGLVKVDYENNRVVRSGAATVMISKE